MAPTATHLELLKGEVRDDGRVTTAVVAVGVVREQRVLHRPVAVGEQ
jgi:hypothetical protein